MPAVVASAERVCPFVSFTVHRSMSSRGKMRPFAVTGSATGTGIGSPSISFSTTSGRSPTTNTGPVATPCEVQMRPRRAPSAAFASTATEPSMSTG